MNFLLPRSTVALAVDFDSGTETLFLLQRHLTLHMGAMSAFWGWDNIAGRNTYECCVVAGLPIMLIPCENVFQTVCFRYSFVTAFAFMGCMIYFDC